MKGIFSPKRPETLSVHGLKSGGNLNLASLLLYVFKSAELFFFAFCLSGFPTEMCISGNSDRRYLPLGAVPPLPWTQSWRTDRPARHKNGEKYSGEESGFVLTFQDLREMQKLTVKYQNNYNYFYLKGLSFPYHPS